MIAKIRGKVIEKGNSYLLVDVGNIVYQVFIPVAVMQRLNEHISGDNLISLITFHYYHLEPSKSIPVLIGFLNEVEKEFFEAFITVSGIGPKAALRALNQPISLIARAIDEGDINFLKSLPGIGQQRAKEIIAKLQNKVGKFGLIKDGSLKEQADKASDVKEEALAVLTQLGYKKSEASSMVKRAIDRSAHPVTTEELLNEVYRQKKIK